MAITARPTALIPPTRQPPPAPASGEARLLCLARMGDHLAHPVAGD